MELLTNVKFTLALLILKMLGETNIVISNTYIVIVHSILMNVKVLGVVTK